MLNTKLHKAREKIIQRAGTPIRVQYFNSTFSGSAVYDDEVTLTQSGNNLWTSGVVLPLNTSNNSSDSILVQQGKLRNDDKRLYTHGSLIFTDKELEVTIRIGSPGTGSENQYSMLDYSQLYSTSNEPIYKQIYIRKIGGTGSLQNT